MDTWKCSCHELNTHPMTKYACYRCFDRRDDVMNAAEQEQQAAEAAEILDWLGPQEPPQDYRIFNRRRADGTYPNIMDFFDDAVKKADAAKAAQLPKSPNARDPFPQDAELGSRCIISGGEVLELDSTPSAEEDIPF